MEKVNISLAGCGFLGIYHVGVASCIKEYAPHLLLNKISGASIGALAGCCLLTDIPLGIFTSEMLHIIYEIRRRTLGPFNPLINVQSMLQNILKKNLPNNAYEIVSGRLFISMTRVHDGSNFIVSEYKSNEELVKALLASAFVPIFSGFIPPKFGEYRYIDGGFSNNLPILDENTITVSPFCGESDICPRDSSVQLFHINLCNTSVEVSKPNIYRFARILFPPSPEVLSMMCKQGFDDALKFLQRNNMISCTKCLSVQRTISLPIVKHRKQAEQHETFDPECEECIFHIKKAACSNLPEPVLTNFERSIEAANKELASWIYRHRSMKIVSFVTLPYLLTADIIMAMLKKFAETAPELIDCMSDYCKQLMELLIKTLNKLNKTGLFLASKVFGPLAYSAYVEGNISRPKEIPPKKKVSLQFNFDSDIKIDTMESDAGKDEETIILHSAEIATDTVNEEVHRYDELIDTIDHNDALMAFYYMDDSNKMNVVEIFDVTNDDKITHTNKMETENDEVAVDSDMINGKMEVDENEATLTLENNHNANNSNAASYEDDGSQHSICSSTNEELNASSDPESEWSRNNHHEFLLQDKNPESDQSFENSAASSGAPVTQTAIAIS